MFSIPEFLTGLNSNLFFQYFLLLAPFVWLLSRHVSRRSPHLDKLPMPPGPRPWPIVGNIFHMGKNPHVSLAQIAKSHGPLISLKLGSQVLVVASSPEVAAEILKTHDRILSGRNIPEAVPLEHHHGLSVVWATECTEKWNTLRAVLRSQLFHSKAIESQAHLRERKTVQMVEYLEAMEGKVVGIRDVVFTTVFNTVSNLLFSKDLLAFEDDGVSANLKEMMAQALKLAVAPNITDFYPILSGSDIQGLRRKSTRFVRKMFDAFDAHIKERASSISGHGVEKEPIDLLDFLLANSFSMDQIRVLFTELLTAGVDTTASTIEWALTELIKNGEAMEKLRQELRDEVKQKCISESQISKLPYLQACVKETLRMHAPTPLLLPRRAAESFEIMNYVVPKDSSILVNVWAIGRDPTIWEDPLTFKPERFLDSDIDFKGQDFEFLPFGAGRRICPGISMASKQLPLVIASLVSSFDWFLPNGDAPAQIDMNDKFGVTLRKEQPLLVAPKRLLEL